MGYFRSGDVELSRLHASATEREREREREREIARAERYAVYSVSQKSNVLSRYRIARTKKDLHVKENERINS
jgi:hypothetical protein